MILLGATRQLKDIGIFAFEIRAEKIQRVTEGRTFINVASYRLTRSLYKQLPPGSYGPLMPSLAH
jgi:hypothetical protein